jgi:hypothetical protein
MEFQQMVKAPMVSMYCQRRREEMTPTTRGRNQDRARVAGGQDHEVRYEAAKEGVSKDAVKKSVEEVGNSRAKIEADLKKEE